MGVTTEPVIVGMSYSEFAKKFGEEKAKEALKRIYGTEDPVKAAEIQKERMKQIIGVQPQQQTQPQPTQTTQTIPGQLLPGYSITTGQPVTQPYKLEPAQATQPTSVSPIVYKPEIKIESVKPETPSQKFPAGFITIPAKAEPTKQQQIGEIVYDVSKEKVVESVIVGGKVVEQKVHTPEKGKAFDVEKIVEETTKQGGTVALRTERVTTLRIPVFAEVPESAKVTDVTYDSKTGEISYTVSREAKEQLGWQSSHIHLLGAYTQAGPYKNLENPYIKAALEKGLTLEQQFRKKIEEAKAEYLEMQRRTPYMQLSEGLAKETAEMEPGVARFIKQEIASIPLSFHSIIYGLTEPIRQAQIRFKYGEAGAIAIKEVQAIEEKAIEEQKERIKAEMEYYRQHPRKAWEDIAKMPLGEKIETALKLAKIGTSAYLLAKSPAPGIKGTTKVSIKPGETKVIAETERGEAIALTKAKMKVEVPGKEVKEYDVKIVSRGFQKGKHVIGEHFVEVKDMKTGKVEHYFAVGKGKKIPQGIKEITKMEYEGQEVVSYRGTDFYIEKQTLYKPETRLVIKPGFDRPIIGLESTVEEHGTTTGLVSYKHVGQLYRPGFEHVKRPIELIGKEAGKAAVVAKGKDVEVAGLIDVKAAMVKTKPVPEAKGFYPPAKISTTKTIIPPEVSEGIKFVFGEKPRIEPIAKELVVGSAEALKSVATIKAPAQPSLAPTFAGATLLATHEAPKIEKASEAYFSKVGTPYPKEEMLTETEEKARVVTVRPEITEEMLSTYLIKQTQKVEEKIKEEERIRQTLIEGEKEIETTKTEEILTTKPIEVTKTRHVVKIEPKETVGHKITLIERLAAREIERLMKKQKVIKRTMPTRVFPAQVPLKVVPFIEKRGTLVLGKRERPRKERLSLSVERFLKIRPITTPKEILKRLRL